jgi:hypothetical protein
MTVIPPKPLPVIAAIMVRTWLGSAGRSRISWEGRNTRGIKVASRTKHDW